MKKILKVIVFCFGLVSILMSCFADDEYISCTSLIAWAKNFPENRDIIYEWEKSVKKMTAYFCEKFSTLTCMDTSDWNIYPDYFDASQSVFLSILCESVQKWINYDQTKSYLYKKSFIDFWFVSSETWYLEPCHYYWNMNDCNYSYNLPQIFNQIMNDFFSVKQARFLWIDKIEENFDAQKAANKFSTEYFAWLTIQKWETSTICDSSSDYYKTTCKKLKGYMTDAMNLLKNTSVIDISKLQDQGEDADCENHRSKNILYCGLLWSKSDYAFVNALYNEYFWYNLFLSYYSFNINWAAAYLNWNYSDISDMINENVEKVALVEDQLQKSKKAITLSLRTLAEMSDSFPLHVWFLMYQDDATMFMEKLAKIYPPIRTLYDKLRNVQVKES